MLFGSDKIFTKMSQNHFSSWATCGPTTAGLTSLLGGCPRINYCPDADLIDFAPQPIEEPSNKPPAMRMTQATIAAFFQPHDGASSSSSCSSQ